MQGRGIYIWKVVIHLETVVRYSVCYLSAVAKPGVGDTQGKYRYPAESDFLKLSKHVQQLVKPMLKFSIFELRSLFI